MSHFIEFPNLGWKFNIDDSIHIGSFSIKWYGLLIAIGFLLAVLYGLKRAEEFGINPDKMIDVALLTVPVAFVGGTVAMVGSGAYNIIANLFRHGDEIVIKRGTPFNIILLSALDVPS